MKSVTRTAATNGNFSEVVTVTGPGTWLYVAGQVAFDDTGTRVIDGGVAAQSEVIFDQIDRHLRQHGATLLDVIKLTTYLVDLSEYSEFSRVRGRRFTGAAPASAAIAVDELLLDARIEIEAIAFVADQGCQ